MDMTDNDDKLLKSFFSEYGVSDVADNGFSSRVMRSLPEGVHLYRIDKMLHIACLVATVVLLFFLGGLASLKTAVGNVVADALGMLVSVPYPSTSFVLVFVAIVAVWGVLVLDTEEMRRFV